MCILLKNTQAISNIFIAEAWNGSGKKYVRDWNNDGNGTTVFYSLSINTNMKYYIWNRDKSFFP